jgi:hypothetical protein
MSISFSLEDNAYCTSCFHTNTMGKTLILLMRMINLCLAKHFLNHKYIYIQVSAAITSTLKRLRNSERVVFTLETKRVGAFGGEPMREPVKNSAKCSE